MNKKLVRCERHIIPLLYKMFCRFMIIFSVYFNSVSVVIVVRIFKINSSSNFVISANIYGFRTKRPAVFSSLEFSSPGLGLSTSNLNLSLNPFLILDLFSETIFLSAFPFAISRVVIRRTNGEDLRNPPV